MNGEIRLRSMVALTEDIPTRSLQRGQVGTVVELLGPDMFEVEFVNNEGRTYAMVRLSARQLLVLHDQPA